MQTERGRYRKSVLAANLAGHCHFWPLPNAICYLWMRNGKIGSMGLVLEHFQRGIDANVLRSPSVIATQGAAHQLKKLLLAGRHSNINNYKMG